MGSNLAQKVGVEYLLDLRGVFKFQSLFLFFITLCLIALIFVFEFYISYSAPVEFHYLLHGERQRGA